MKNLTQFANEQFDRQYQIIEVRLKKFLVYFLQIANEIDTENS